MVYVVLHGHGTAAPRNKRSYIKLGRTFKTKKAARTYAKKNLTSESFRYVPKSRVRHTGHKGLYYITK